MPKNYRKLSYFRQMAKSQSVFFLKENVRYLVWMDL